MSRLIRELALANDPRAFYTAEENRAMDRDAMQRFYMRASGQRSNLPSALDVESVGDPATDYLKGPSMASILLKNAKGLTLRNLLEMAQLEGADPEVAARRMAQNEAEMRMAPMIASVQQLDR